MRSCAVIKGLVLKGCFIFVVFGGILAEDTDTTGGTTASPSFAGPIPNITVTLGEDAAIPCMVNNLGDYALTWIHVNGGYGDEHLMTVKPFYSRGYARYDTGNDEFGTWWLRWENVQEYDKGEYLCRIGTSPYIEKSVYLDVQVPPKIDDENTTSDTNISEGSDVSLHCQASGYPTPNITWRREDQKDIQGGNSIINGDYLNITEVNRLSMGAYLCTASNGAEPSSSKRIMLNVKFSPTIWIANMVVCVTLDKNAFLECGLESYPQSETFWKKDDILILSNSKYDTMLQDLGSYRSKMQLKIRNLKKADYGSYTCVAKNVVGESERTIKLYESEDKECDYFRKNGMRSSGINALPSFFSLTMHVAILITLLQVF